MASFKQAPPVASGDVVVQPQVPEDNVEAGLAAIHAEPAATGGAQVVEMTTQQMQLQMYQMQQQMAWQQQQMAWQQQQQMKAQQQQPRPVVMQTVTVKKDKDCCSGCLVLLFCPCFFPCWLCC